MKRFLLNLTKMIPLVIFAQLLETSLSKQNGMQYLMVCYLLKNHTNRKQEPIRKILHQQI